MTEALISEYRDRKIKTKGGKILESVDTIHLKSELNGLFKTKGRALDKLSRFIVEDWGHIHNCGDEFLKNAGALATQSLQDTTKDAQGNLAFLSPKTIKEKLKGKHDSVPSWSKVLAFANPEYYFVYDSRVAFILLILWLIYKKQKGIKDNYPFLPNVALRGRIPQEQRENLEKLIAKLQGDLPLPKPEKRMELYINYVKLVHKLYQWESDKGISASKKPIDAQNIEMGLFALTNKGKAKSSAQKEIDIKETLLGMTNDALIRSVINQRFK